ncbi:MAG: hypothetical protein ABI422_02855 [Sphingomicrobium sp.]
MITAVFVAVMMQSAAIDGQRTSYLACLKTGMTSAQSNKMPADSFEAYLRENCAAIEATFEASMIAFDVKNKVPRKQAASDAKLQVDDFVTSSVERYRLITAPR